MPLLIRVKGTEDNGLRLRGERLPFQFLGSIFYDTDGANERIAKVSIPLPSLLAIALEGAKPSFAVKLPSVNFPKCSSGLDKRRQATLDHVLELL